MSYENLGNLQALNNVLEMMDHLIEDEDYFNLDREEFMKNLNDFLRSSSELLQEVLEDDPELPLDHEAFLAEVKVLKDDSDITFHKLEQFGMNELTPFMKSLEDLLEEMNEPPKRELFNQLSIPILTLMNHQPHPTRPGYLVYHFKMKAHADYFEELLLGEGLYHERFDEERKGEWVYWFGVREQDHDPVEIINYTVKGKFRKPLIKDKAARMFVIAFGILIILFAIVGAIMSN